jgi:hypothetical protein
MLTRHWTTNSTPSLLLRSRNMEEAELLEKLVSTARDVIARDTEEEPVVEVPMNEEEKEELEVGTASNQEGTAGTETTY